MPDDFLVAAMVAGDWQALDALMTRYDRLVRYTIFRASRAHCLRDPAWLDSAASSAWAAFVDAARREGHSGPRSARNLVVAIARNHAISAVRQASRRRDAPAGGTEPPERSVADADPAILSEEVEQLACLWDCVEQLSLEDRVIFSQLGLITERHWREAAAALGRSESTLRSQWKRILEKLQDLMASRMGSPVAPSELPGD